MPRLATGRPKLAAADDLPAVVALSWNLSATRRVSLGRPVAPGHSRFFSWSVTPLAIIVLTLLGSVIVPARQTMLITELLRHNTEVLAPARLFESELRSGLAEEMGALQGYALSGDTTLLVRYRTIAAEDERRLNSLDALSVGLTPASVLDMANIRRRTDDWRQRANATLERRGSHAAFIRAVTSALPQYDATLGAIDDLSSALAAEAGTRDDRVRVLDQSSLIWNSGLVLAALAALYGAVLLTQRERRLAATLRHRVDEESALRQLARALSGAVTLDEALQSTVAGALATARVVGAYVEWKVDDEDRIDVVVGFRDKRVTPRTRVASADSLTEAMVTRGNGEGLMEVGAIGERLRIRTDDSCRHCFGLVAPLVSAEDPCGVLVLMREAGAPAFAADERRQIQLIGDLASATLRRMDGMATERRALDSARRRARQEVALREAAEALAGAFTMDAVTEEIAHAALEALEGQGTFVEAIVAQPDETGSLVTVRAAAGSRVPPFETRFPYAGSLTQQVLVSGAPLLIPDLAKPGYAGAVGAFREGGGAAIVVPLGTIAAPVGALFVLSAARGHFRVDDVARAAIFGHLAAMAYEKLRILDDAYDGRRKLERVLQSRSRLMRGFSHDVKNPIGAADGYAALLSEGIYGELSADQSESIRRIRRCIREALSLIDDLHELARAETGNIAPLLEPIDLASLVCTISEEYQAAARAAGLSLLVVAEPGVPVVQTNKARVRQIVSNLLSNAIKYSERGRVTMRTLFQAEGPFGTSDHWALVAINDTGIGIPVNKQDFIFEEFSRIEGSEKPGAGLGLAISKLLAEALGGHISVVSELGEGSTFTLWLPVQEAEGPLTTSAKSAVIESS